MSLTARGESAEVKNQTLGELWVAADCQHGLGATDRVLLTKCHWRDMRRLRGPRLRHIELSESV
jgi:hypothetical protein